MVDKDNKELYNDLINDHNFIESVIDAYLVVKSEVKDKEYMERYDFIHRVIDHLKK